MSLSQLVVTTPLNPTYAGTAFGVVFQDGQAVVSAHGKPNRYGYTLDQLAAKFRTDLGDAYHLQAFDEAGRAVDVSALVAVGEPELEPELSVDTAPNTAAPSKAKPTRKTTPKKPAARKTNAALN